ncbi:MAG TPA: lysophospholipid acyltransferase family protein [Candidatus Binatia bacterium]|nr:lysophospholipid acyltransferase family protein [Candidatus Binatia bacterium]
MSEAAAGPAPLPGEKPAEKHGPSLLALAYALYAAAVLAVIVFVAGALLVMTLPTQAARRRAGRWSVLASMAAIAAPLHVRGREHLPPGPCLVVSNHASYVDGPVLAAALPERFTFVVQDGAERWPYVGPAIRRMGVAFVNRRSAREGARQTRALIRRVQQGESLAVFAEGTFENAPGLLPFRNGAFMIAAHAGVPVVPAVIRGTRTLFGGGRLRLRRSRVEVEFFPALAPGGEHREAVVALRDAARAVVLAHCGEPDASPARKTAGA